MQTQYEELTDTQWQIIEQILNLHRKRKYSLRYVVDAILQVLRTGTQWPNLKHPIIPWRFIPWWSVYYYFRKWKADGRLERLNATLNHKERIGQGKAARPSLLCIDSQSVKSVAFVSQHKGIDGNKCVNGRKKHLIVDTLGLVWGVVVHAADLADATKAHLLVAWVIYTEWKRFWLTMPTRMSLPIG